MGVPMKYPWAGPGVQVQCIEDAWVIMNGKRMGWFGRWLHGPLPVKDEVYTIEHVIPGTYDPDEVYLALRGVGQRASFAARSFRPLQHNQQQVEEMRKLTIRTPREEKVT